MTDIFLDEVAGWILELDRGQGIPYQGNYSGWLEQKQKRLEQEGRDEDSRVKSLSRELEWVRSAPKARQSKSKARLNAYEKLLEQDREQRNETTKITITAGPRLVDVVIEADGLEKGFGEKLLFEGVDFRLPPGGIVGVIGPNGAGKSTLFKLLTGQEDLDKGALRLGETVKLGYVDQSRDELDDRKTVWEAISDGLDELELGKRTMPSRAYVSLFNFKGSDQQKRVGQLSGGERNRVHLARMLKSGANVLLLDEPTNDLDVDTLRALEEALLDFAGCAVVVSHDICFLDRIATHILAFEGGSHVEWFEGNYQAYEEDKKRRLGVDAAQPRRIKYKPISDKKISRHICRQAVYVNLAAGFQLFLKRFDQGAKPASIAPDKSRVSSCCVFSIEIFSTSMSKILLAYLAAQRSARRFQHQEIHLICRE